MSIASSFSALISWSYQIETVEVPISSPCQYFINADKARRKSPWVSHCLLTWKTVCVLSDKTATGKEQCQNWDHGVRRQKVHDIYGDWGWELDVQMIFFLVCLKEMVHYFYKNAYFLKSQKKNKDERMVLVEALHFLHSLTVILKCIVFPWPMAFCFWEFHAVI